jgi:inhibitor of cysteine peptidase
LPGRAWKCRVDRLPESIYRFPRVLISFRLMKTRVLLMVAVLVAAAVSGCSGGPGRQAATTTVEVSIDDVLQHSVIGREVALAVGDTLKVTLGSNHTTPYRWTTDAKIGDATIVRQTGHEYLRPKVDLMGAPGAEVWVFDALKAGTTTIVTDYAGIVGSDPAPVCTFTARVTVRR